MTVAPLWPGKGVHLQVRLHPGDDPGVHQNLGEQLVVGGAALVERLGSRIAAER